MNNRWTKEEIPDLTGKVAIVTGANSGIGYETANALAEKGAAVVMACRNLDKAHAAADSIHREVAAANLKVIRLDLANLDSVRAFGATFKAEYVRLDLLINNAGVMIPPYTRTVDGFELQFGANHLGHFALTGLLLDRILATPGARVVNVSSNAHRIGNRTIDFDNLNGELGYNPSGAYAQSKLANLLFTLELNRRFKEIGADTTSTAAHPGWTVTGLQRGILHGISRVVGQRPPVGALPTLRAAIDPAAMPNEYFGPAGFMEMRGYPVKVGRSQAAQDSQQARKLWEVSEQMTGIKYAWRVAEAA